MKSKIRKLAKKTLKDKWLPALKGKKGKGLAITCCFCEDSIHDCYTCLLTEYRDVICVNIYNMMEHEAIQDIVNKLKEIKKTGKLVW